MSSDELRGVVLQIEDAAPAGLLGRWARARGIALDVVAIEDPLPEPEPRRHALAVVLGSTHSLAQDLPPWADDVLAWLRAADDAGVPVLGICFGAQALAAAFGGSVHRLGAPEIGWVTVETADPQRVPAGPWMAWHEDGLRPPPHADVLATNAFGAQAFSVGHHLAVQFHPEATTEIVATWASFPHSRLPETGQTGEELLAACEAQAGAAPARAERLFDAFAARAGRVARPAR